MISCSSPGGASVAAVEVGWLGVKGEPLLGSTMDMVKALRIKGVVKVKMRALAATFKWQHPGRRGSRLGAVVVSTSFGRKGRATDMRNRGRSEEHTSELQSRPHLVCRLLLEKKKNEIV